MSIRRPLLLASLLLLAVLSAVIGPRLIDHGPWPGVGPLKIDRLALKEQAATRRGTNDAQAAIRANQLSLLKMGPVSPAFVAETYQRFRVRIQPSSLCGLDTVEGGAYTDAFNNEMCAEIRRRFGSSALAPCREAGTIPP